jgi:hypothetical protein
MRRFTEIGLLAVLAAGPNFADAPSDPPGSCGAAAADYRIY